MIRTFKEIASRALRSPIDCSDVVEMCECGPSHDEPLPYDPTLGDACEECIAFDRKHFANL